MAYNKVEITGVNTSNLKVLKPSEIEELFKKMHSGDKKAKDELVEGNLRLVLSILKKFNKKDINMDDLFQVGCMGLIKAIDNFDFSHEAKFSTYAVPMILGEVRRYIRDNNSIRVSRSVKDLGYRALKAKEELTNKYGREATIDEISKEINESSVDIVNALDAMRSPVSMFEPIYNDGGDVIYLFDQLEDKKDSNKSWDSTIALNKALKSLKTREKNILLARFIIGKTQMEIADEIGISQAQVSRLEKTAIDNVKRLIK